MTRGRKNTWLHIGIMISLLLASGCSSSSDTASRLADPYPAQDISGVWWGFLGSTFAVGIITKESFDDEYSVWFIGQDNKDDQYRQFISKDGSLLTQKADAAIFTGYLEDCSWNTNGLDYSTKSIRPLYIWAAASTKGAFGGPLYSAYTYSDKTENGILAFYYNTTYEVTPDVNNLSGQWTINDSFKAGNTVSLTITPYAQSTSGATISWNDNNGNDFNGTIVIFINPLDSKPHNVYEVNLKLNDTINLSGLAAYVLETDAEGLTITKKTLAIGATNSDKTYSFSGLAEFQE